MSSGLPNPAAEYKRHSLNHLSYHSKSCCHHRQEEKVRKRRLKSSQARKSNRTDLTQITFNIHNEVRSNPLLRRPRRLPPQPGPVASRGRQEEDGEECRLARARAQEPLPQTARILPAAPADPGRHRAEASTQGE